MPLCPYHTVYLWHCHYHTVYCFLAALPLSCFLAAVALLCRLQATLLQSGVGCHGMCYLSTVLIGCCVYVSIVIFIFTCMLFAYRCTYCSPASLGCYLFLYHMRCPPVCLASYSFLHAECVCSLDCSPCQLPLSQLLHQVLGTVEGGCSWYSGRSFHAKAATTAAKMG